MSWKEIIKNESKIISANIDLYETPKEYESEVMVGQLNTEHGETIGVISDKGLKFLKGKKAIVLLRIS